MVQDGSSEHPVPVTMPAACWKATTTVPFGALFVLFLFLTTETNYDHLKRQTLNWENAPTN